LILRNPFRRDSSATAAAGLYEAAVAQARRPEFYIKCGVPDTVDGRFDLIAVHVFLVLHRLKRDHPASAGLAQAVLDAMFSDMDRSLREMGAGDLGVGRRVKRMAEGLNGRIAAYEAGLTAPERTDLGAALRRNLYGTVTPESACVAALAAYVQAQAGQLAAQGLDALATGTVAFGDPPTA